MQRGELVARRVVAGTSSATAGKPVSDGIDGEAGWPLCLDRFAALMGNRS